MRKSIAAALVLLLGGSQSVPASEHVVSQAAIDRQLQEAMHVRSRDLATIEHALAMPEAVRVASQLGVRIERVRQAAPHLSDSELHDLAARARLLTMDPVSGDTSGTNFFPTTQFWIVLIVLVLLVVALAFGVKALID